MKWENLIRFFDEANRLKKTKRAGWVVDKVENSESVADHSFETALMCIMLGRNRNFDIERVLKMAIMHDIAEAKTGDIITNWRYEKAVPKGEKLRKEKEAIEKMVSKLDGGKEIVSLWEEFEDGKTEEAKFVRQVEKLEMSLQALEYEKEGNDNVRNHYHVETEEVVKDPELADFLKEMLLILRKNKL